ncbi:hypothetical protein OG590_39250 (plasmid) [Streptomyces goshikiensis]|uniref:hypothetical protein n=1 Tax=Streptomyces goshikiensis TaxID=1942 RepID=UPI00386B9E46|nr:hypothetical protein OG590_39250 [Streptomyces goshikiensis]
MTRALPTDVAHVLDTALSMLVDPGLALHRQMRHLRLEKCCACGCGSTYFSLDADGVSPVPAPALTGTQVVADIELFGADGATVGEVLVFAEDGYLAWLEVCSWTEDTFTLIDAHRILCPCDR